MNEEDPQEAVSREVMYHIGCWLMNGRNPPYAMSAHINFKRGKVHKSKWG